MKRRALNSKLEIIRAGFFVTFSHFEENSVNDTGDDAAGNRANPINLKEFFLN